MWLERIVELEGAQLRLREWPGTAGPLVHVPDPLSPSGMLVETLGAALGPDYRVISVEPRAGQPYQVQAIDVLGMLAQFGFVAPLLIGERLGCAAALLVAAWFPSTVSKLVLVDPIYEAPGIHAHSVEARALRDCPPDWPSLRRAVQCPLLVLRWNDAVNDTHLRGFLQLP